MRTESKWGWAAAALFALAPLSPTAKGAEISGTVFLSGKTVADAVVSVEGLVLNARPDEQLHVMDHRDLAFTPHVIVVRVGSSVKFENSDGMPCHIYSASRARPFARRPDDPKPMILTFERPGVIEVRCAEHGHLLGYVVVKENPLFARTDGNGRYEIGNVPPGRYTLQAWHEGEVIGARIVDVKGTSLTIDFEALVRKSQAKPSPDSDPFAQGVSSPPYGLTADFQEILWRKE